MATTRVAIRLGPAIENYMKIGLADLAPNTLRNHKACLGQLSRLLSEQAWMRSIRPQTFAEAWYSRESPFTGVSPRTKRPLLISTIHENRVRLEQFFQYGMKLNWLDEDPFRDVRRVRVPTRRAQRVILDCEEDSFEVFRLFDLARRTPHRLMMYTQVITGRRIGDLLNLRVGDFAVKDGNGTITHVIGKTVRGDRGAGVEDTDHRDQYDVCKQDGTEVTKALSPELTDELTRWLGSEYPRRVGGTIHASYPLFPSGRFLVPPTKKFGGPVEAPGETLWMTKSPPTPLNVQAGIKVVRGYLNELGIQPGSSTHVLRRTAAMRPFLHFLKIEGFESALFVAQQLLDHVSPSVTIRYLDLSRFRDAATSAIHSGSLWTPPTGFGTDGMVGAGTRLGANVVVPLRALEAVR
jgi:integrase